MGSVQAAAAHNSGAWCDAVCRTHGIDTTVDEEAWACRTRTPPYYPDAVTLVPDPSVSALLARVDASPGCSIKDSFASMDLAAVGFRVLFDAEWIHRVAMSNPPAVAGPAWDVVRDPDGFAIWEQRWRGDDGPGDVLRVDLLDNESVAVLVARAGKRIVAGATLNRSRDVIGISNFFADPAVASVSWEGCVAFVSTLFPGSVLVGYGSGAALDAARATGFEAAGPLRVWIR